MSEKDTNIMQDIMIGYDDGFIRSFIRVVLYIMFYILNYFNFVKIKYKITKTILGNKISIKWLHVINPFKLTIVLDNKKDLNCNIMIDVFDSISDTVYSKDKFFINEFCFMDRDNFYREFMLKSNVEIKEIQEKLDCLYKERKYMKKLERYCKDNMGFRVWMTEGENLSLNERYSLTYSVGVGGMAAKRKLPKHFVEWIEKENIDMEYKVRFSYVLNTEDNMNKVKNALYKFDNRLGIKTNAEMDKIPVGEGIITSVNVTITSDMLEV